MAEWWSTLKAGWQGQARPACPRQAPARKQVKAAPRRVNSLGLQRHCHARCAVLVLVAPRGRPGRTGSGAR
eukprot:14354475-Alexandrium_andersonii.AAC.1